MYYIGFLIGYFLIMVILMGIGIAVAKKHRTAAWVLFAAGAVIELLGIIGASSGYGSSMYNAPIIWIIYAAIAAVSARLIYSRSSGVSGKKGGNMADNTQPKPAQSDVSAAVSAQIESGRPAQFDAGRSAVQPERILIPEVDEDFYEEKTVASFDDWTVPVEEEEEDEKTLPFFMAEQPRPKAVLTRYADGQRIECTGSMFTVGKSQASADYKIADSQKISRQHATFYERGGNYYIVDNSKNGTMINGATITSGQQVPVRDGDRIRFADVDFIFNVE